MTLLNSHRFTWAILGGILTAAAVLLWIAPAEQTLGQGLKIVFLHAALIQTGFIGLIVAGLLGLASLVTDRAAVAVWNRAVGTVALAFYLGGMVASLAAAQVNWGGLGLAEPRMAAGINTALLAIIVWIAGGWLKDLPHGLRITGALSAALAAYLVWSVATTPLVLHPDNPINTSPSAAIRLSFYALLALSILAAVWAVWWVRGVRSKEKAS
jgi:hypothetical protein